MSETWKDIPGYDGKYQASTQGRIRSVGRYVNGKNPYTNKPFRRKIKGQILRPGQFCKSGHVSVVLEHGTPGKPVHQLVMRTFVGNPKEGEEVRHINGNPTDNRLENLEYGTRTQNILDVYYQGKRWRKLCIDDVYLIRFYFLCGFKGSEIAKIFNLSQTTVSKIKLGRIFAWLE